MISLLFSQTTIEYLSSFPSDEDDSPKMSIFSYNNHTYYTYHLNKIDVTTEKGNTYPLKEALEGGHITLED